MGFAIGIDLGTANTRIAVYRRDQFEVIPHEGQSLMPSYVAFTGTGRLIGQAAKNQASVNPKNTIFDALRFVGFTFNSPYVQGMIKLLPFTVTHDGAIAEEKRKPVFEVMYKDVLTTFTPVEILAMIIKRAKKDAEKYLGHPIVNAIITMPSYFNLSQQFAIKDAVLIAGINVLRVIHAPTVALADLIVTQKMPGERNVLMCDIGAGYYGVVLATLEEGIQEIKAVWGDDSCVGDDYDRRLMNHMINWFKRATKKDFGEEGKIDLTDVTDNSRALRRLRTACEKVKHQLSSAEEAVVEIEQLHDGKDLKASITRKRFEELIQDLIRSLLEPIERVLRDAKLDKSRVHDIVLIGGSSRIPKIQKVISDFFNGKAPIRCLNLEETSARGAAFHAAILSGDTTSKTTYETILMDIASRSLGIETTGGVMTVLVKRGATIPTKKSEIFSTFQDNQEFFSVTCYEGERARTKDNMELGHIQVPIPPAPRGVPQLEVTFDIYAGHIICVTVLEKGMGKKSSVWLDGYNARSFDRISKEKVERLILAEEQMEVEDDLEEARIEARNTTEELVYSIKDWINWLPLERRCNSTTTFETLAGTFLDWLDENQFATAQEYETRTQQLQTLRVRVEREQVAHERSYSQQKPGRSEGTEEESEVRSKSEDEWEALALAFGGGTQKKKEKKAIVAIEEPALPPPIPTQHKREPVPSPSGPTTNDAIQASTIDLRRATVEDAPDDDKREFEYDQPPSNWKGEERSERNEEVKQRHEGVDSAANDNMKSGISESELQPDGKGRQLEAGSSNSPPNEVAGGWDRTEAGLDEALGHIDQAMKPPSWSSTPTAKQVLEGQGPARSDTPRTAARGMASLFDKPTEGSLTYTDTEFIQISTYLKNTGQPDWSKIPRLYTVLRLIDQLDMLDVFIRQGITDIWFPFAQTTLPRALSPSARANFLKHQEVVLSKSLLFEKSPERKHARFLQGEPLPYEVVGKLGAGAHGQVDKVMSTVSHREYARKLFRRVRGMSKDAINSFLIELQVLKRVQHYHCIELVQSYTDPKYFALIMSPVGDCNLLEYYSIALNNPDKSSLLRSYFGCLANALQYIHSIKIRHRDIKPHNILVRGDRVFLTDFGIALDWEELSRSTTTADSGKTWLYAAPEVAKYEKRNTAADVWSLGCVFMEMATILKGQPISAMRKFFEEESGNYRFYANISRLTSWADNCRQLGSEKDGVVFNWILLMLEEDPEKRPTAATLHHDISVECTRQGVPFSGTCCLENVESSGIEDEDDDEAWDVGGKELTLVPGKVPEMA